MRYLTIIIFFLSTFSYGQDYKPVFAHREATFLHEHNFIVLKIDSIGKEGNDSVYYPVKEIRYDQSCYYPNGDSWAGKKIILQENGTYIFFNYNGDSIFINPHYGLGQSWTHSDFTYTVISHEIENVLGFPDSVKTINVNGDPMFKISKNYGFVSIIPFYYIPFSEIIPEDKKFGISCSSIDQYTLSGIDNVGINNLTVEEIFDFEIGDEIHIVEENISNTPSLSPIIRKEKTFTISKYISKTDNANNLEYTLIRTKYIQKQEDSYYNSFIKIDTITESYVKDGGWLNTIPGKNYETVHNGLNAFTMKFSLWGLIGKYDLITPYEWSGDNCYDHNNTHQCVLEQEYIQGLGGPYHQECTVNYPGASYKSKRELVYYKKANVEAGEKLFLNTEIFKKEFSTCIAFPNPCSGSVLNFNNSADLDKIEVYTLQGLKIKEFIKDGLKNGIIQHNLPSGLYLFKIFKNDNFTTIKVNIL